MGRWIRWFQRNKRTFENALKKLKEKEMLNLLNPIFLITNRRTKGAGWLKELAAAVVQSGNRVPT